MVTLKRDKKAHDGWLITTTDSEGFHRQLAISHEDMTELMRQWINEFKRFVVMKPIKVCVYKKSSPVYVNIEKIDEAFQNCHLLIYNLTEHQKDKVLELIKSFENVTIDYIPNDTAQQEKADATKNTNP